MMMMMMDTVTVLPYAHCNSSVSAQYTRNSAIADKLRDAFVLMQWRG